MIENTDIESYLNFVPSSAPRTTVTELSELYQRLSDKRSVTIHDVRNADKEFQLDVNGFQFYKHPLPTMPNYGSETIKNHIYPDTVRFLKENLGVSRVEIFEHVLRNAHDDTVSETTGERGPSYVVHVDHSCHGANKILREVVPEADVDHLTQTRWALINVWRPLETVHKDPLAVCDAQSSGDDDVVELFVDFFDETAAAAKEKRVDVQWSVVFGQYSAAQEWWYMSKMTTEDLVAFKIFDTQGGNDTWCMHSSFPDPKTSDSQVPRKSIEVRCFVFWEDQSAD
ncbi:uncharacterized protein N7511_006881 [Penicillium nucicola]|uniref:uncharacterized protein n=1 Tax=Penicillium nucicola TaxID=1850975 RepID=UPI0025455DCF|nr:uncharacterized protein N7511_006881 [Penicillium nucicola]KAJ5758187.1 hypothetical protein N7511_006881 [Penicillium nucicola]